MPHSPSLAAYDLLTEYRVTPLGIDERSPRFSWLLSGEARGAAQSAFRVRVHALSYVAGAAEALVWESGWRDARSSLDVAYNGAPLVSTTRYRWSLDLRDAAGMEFAAGESWFEMGLLNPADFSGNWVHRPVNAPRIALSPRIGTPSAQAALAAPLSARRNRAAAHDRPGAPLCHGARSCISSISTASALVTTSWRPAGPTTKTASCTSRSR